METNMKADTASIPKRKAETEAEAEAEAEAEFIWARDSDNPNAMEHPAFLIKNEETSDGEDDTDTVLIRWTTTNTKARVSKSLIRREDSAPRRGRGRRTSAAAAAGKREPIHVKIKEDPYDEETDDESSTPSPSGSVFKSEGESKEAGVNTTTQKKKRKTGGNKSIEKRRKNTKNPDNPSAKRSMDATTEALDNANKNKKQKSSAPKKLNKTDQKWMDMYYLLKEYKAQNGHTHVSETDDYTPGPCEMFGSKRGRMIHNQEHHALHKWVSRQRVAKKSGKIRADREELLNEIDFYWNGNDYEWDQWYNEIVEMKKEVGHLDIPSLQSQLTKENEVYAHPRLMNWADEQRLRYTLYQKKYKTTMTERRIKKLNGIGFTWCRDDEDKARLEKKAESTNRTHILRNFKYLHDARKMFDAIKQAKDEHAETGEPTVARIDSYWFVGVEPDGTFLKFHPSDTEEMEKKGNRVICFGF